MLLSTAVCAIFGLGQHGVALVGHIPAGLPTPGLPKVHLGDVRELILPALGVLLVAFSDDVLTARAFERGGEVIDANTELLALGVSNAGAGLLHSFPISSSGSRTAIGLAAGAHTQAYSLTALASILGVLLFARPVLASFPEAALGAIVVYAAVRLIDVQAFRRLAAFRRSEFVLALAACAGVLVFDILYGVVAAVALSVAELLWRVGRPHDAIQGLVPGLVLTKLPRWLTQSRGERGRSADQRGDYLAQNLTGYQVRPALVVHISSPWIAGFPATKQATVGLMNSSEVSGVPPPVPGTPNVVQVCPRLAER